ncbi:MAG: hypothetical protein ACTSPI_00110 [Candidatus Heimdallarchaeaceae archaeon]
MPLSRIGDYLLLSAAMGAPLALGTKRGLNIMKQNYEPLGVRLQKARLDSPSNKFAAFKKEREKIATLPSLAQMTPLVIGGTTLSNVLGGVGSYLSPTADVAGYKTYEWMFPGLRGMSAKVQAPEEALKSLVTGAGGELGKSVARGMSKIIDKLIAKNTETVFATPRRKMILEQLRREDEYIKKIPLKQTLEAYHTMIEHAPTLSMDKNAVKSFLRSIAMSPEGGVDWNTIKGIADAEVSILKAKETRGKL